MKKLWANECVHWWNNNILKVKHKLKLMIMSPTHGSKIDPVHSRLTSRVYIFQMWYAFVYYIFNGTPLRKKKNLKKNFKKKLISNLDQF